MTRRSADAEQQFGSDSFLDIIANIVGILIILIVVAGVKVARQTNESAIPDDAPAATSEPLPPLMAEDESSDGTVPSAAQQSFVWDDPFAVDETAEDSVDDFEAQLATLRLQLAETQGHTAASEEELRQLVDRLESETSETQQLAMLSDKEEATESVFRLRESLAETSGQLASYRTTLQSLNQRQNYVSEALGQVALETRQLRETLESLEQRSESADRINHRLSPVGETVTDHEIHFRIAEGRIAHIPLEQLLERLKTQVSGRRGVVMKYHRYEGLVGPVGGFRMNYVVTREASSPLQSLQYGRSVYRMAVARWTIVPADTLHAEPLEDALKVGSRFRQIMESTDPEVTVTIWLYPDDFNKFAAVREFAHNLNLRVAARPLPEGTPIQGSPSGSRSTSQ